MGTNDLTFNPVNCTQTRERSQVEGLRGPAQGCCRLEAGAKQLNRWTRDTIVVHQHETTGVVKYNYLRQSLVGKRDRI